MTDALKIAPERLIEETRWLQSLARHLAGPDDADDLAQATWLRALEQPPDRIRGLRPWLRTVLRNAFRRSRTDQAARVRRETAAARSEALPSAAELAARMSLHRAVADAVLALDEPARSTVILRFFEDRKPQEIARLQNIAVATVHTRLRRALAILRARLDRERGGRAAWVALASPVAAFSATATKGALLGGIAMTATTKAGIGAACTLLIALGVVLTWKSPEPPPVIVQTLPPMPEETPVPVAPPPTPKITPRDAAPEAEPRPVPPAEPASPAPAAPRVPTARSKGSLDGRILMDPFVPTALVVVEVDRVAGSLAGHPNAIALDSQGRFKWPVEAADSLKISVGATGVDEPLASVFPIEVHPGIVNRDRRLDPLDLRGRLRLARITVVDRQGRPVSGAVIYVEPRAGAGSEYGVTTSADGTASLLMAAGAVDLRVEASGFRTEPVRGVSGDTRVMLRSGPHISFRFDGNLPSLPKGTVPTVRLRRIRAQEQENEDGPHMIRRTVLADGRIGTFTGGRNVLNHVVADFKLDTGWAATDVAVPEPGTFEVAISLIRESRDGGSGFSVEDPPMPRIVVEDHDRLQPVSCPAPQAAAIHKTLKRIDESVRRK